MLLVCRRTAKQLDTVRVTCVRIDKSETRYQDHGLNKLAERTSRLESGAANEPTQTTILRSVRRVELQPVRPHS